MPHTVGGPSIERTADGTVSGFEVGWRDPLLVDDVAL